MRSRLKYIFLKNPSNPVFWISIALLVKGLVPFLQLFFAQRPDPHLLSFGFIGDTPSYIDPINNLLVHGHYYPDHRMPGYGAIYYLFRLIFSYNTAFNIIVIVQLAVSALSVYSLALLARIVLKSDRAFYLTFYLFLISNYSNYFDICLMTESLSSSFLIFGTLYFALYIEKQKWNALFLSGFFLTWVAFMRPAFVAILGIYGVVFIVHSIKNKIPFIKPMLIYGLAFIVADGAWIVRNYKVHHKFIPLSNGVYYPYIGNSYMIHMQKFIQSWGGAVDIPDPNSAISWFGGPLFPGEPSPKKYDSIPGYIYTSAFNKDSLYVLRKEVEEFMTLQKPALDSFFISKDTDWNKAFAIFYEPLKPVSPKAAALQNNINAKFDRYKNSIREEKPFLYYVTSRVILLRKFLFENNKTFLTRGQIPGIGNLVVLFYHLYYYFTLFLGIAGMFLLAWQGLRRNFSAFLLCSIPAYTIFIHPFVRLADNRYLLPAWPFAIICACYIILIITSRGKSYFSAKK